MYGGADLLHLRFLWWNRRWPRPQPSFPHGRGFISPKINSQSSDNESRARIKLYWDTLTNWPKPDAGNYATLSGRDLDKTHFYIERNAFMYLMLADSHPVQATSTPTSPGTG